MSVVVTYEGAPAAPKPRASVMWEEGAMTSGKWLAVAIVIAPLLATWTFRYETWGLNNNQLRNRITGATCPVVSGGCW
jgi:hypothetical protein